MKILKISIGALLILAVVCLCAFIFVNLNNNNNKAEEETTSDTVGNDFPKNITLIVDSVKENEIICKYDDAVNKNHHDEKFENNTEITLVPTDKSNDFKGLDYKEGDCIAVTYLNSFKNDGKTIIRTFPDWIKLDDTDNNDSFSQGV